MTEPAAQDNTRAADNTGQAAPSPDADSDPVTDETPVTDARSAPGAEGGAVAIDPAGTPAPDDGAPDDAPDDLATPAPADVAGVIGLLEQAIAALRTLDTQEG